jgi:hypothetical protein
MGEIGRERGTAAGREDGPVGESFRRGNVNFDLLQPEKQVPGDKTPASGGETPGPEMSKRGLFFKDRQPRPLKMGTVICWAALFLGSSATLAWSLAFGRSFVWLMLFPVVILAMLWSATMLAVIFARPR